MIDFAIGAGLALLLMGFWLLVAWARELAQLDEIQRLGEERLRKDRP